MEQVKQSYIMITNGIIQPTWKGRRISFGHYPDEIWELVFNDKTGKLEDKLFPLTDPEWQEASNFIKENMAPPFTVSVRIVRPGEEKVR